MDIISEIDGFEAPWQDCVLTLGDFDGIHRGHRKLIDTTLKYANRLQVPAVVVTYHPSPKKVLRKLKTDSQVYTKDEKITLLQKFPLRAAVFLPFDEQMAKMTASDFLKKILLDKLHARHIVIGYDHRFGFNRHGDYGYLKMASKKHDFKVKQIGPVKLWREVISSSAIRKYLRAGKVTRASRLLGHPYLITGTVIRGKQRGRLLGIPTANLRIAPEKLIPKEGVYYCVAQYGPKTYKAVVNIGFNPTFENIDLSVEAHILGFNDDIYGDTLRIYFLKRLRDEKKFHSIEALKEQIQKDINKAKKQNIIEL